MGRRGPWIGGKLTERPSAIFQRHVRVCPYPEDDVVKIVRTWATVTRSSWAPISPTAKEWLNRCEFEALVADLSAPEQQKILHDNALDSGRPRMTTAFGR